MPLRCLEFCSRQAFINILRQRYMAVAAVLTLAGALLVGGAGTLALLNINIWTRAAGDELEIWAHLNPRVSRARAVALRREISRWPNVRSIRLHTKEAGFRELSALFHHPAMEGLENPLGDALRVKAASPANVLSLGRALRGLPEVDKVFDAGDAVRWIRAAAGVVRLGTFVAAGLLALVAVVVAANTVGLTLFARRREIGIMQLVGATGGFVAGPFLIEGALLGTGGAVVALALLAPGYAYLLDHWPAATLNVALAPADVLAPLGGGLLGIGFGLGLLSSGFSVRRFLRGAAAGEQPL